MMEQDKELRLLKEKRDRLYNELRETGEEIDRLELKKLGGIDYTGKYIKIPGYGCIKVSYQEITGDEIFIHGFKFSGNYFEFFYIDLDASSDIKIPISVFTQYIKKNQIKEISKEEFISEYKKLIEGINSGIYRKI